MANDWIKMELCLPEKPEVIQLANMLEVTEYCIVGMLHKLWGWFDTHTVNGHAVGVTFVFIDRYIGVTGFAESVASVGWLIDDGDGVEIPGFDIHNGESAKKRAQAAKRKSKQRAQEVTEPAGQMSRSERDKSVTREEKRREYSLNPHKPPSKGGGVSRFDEWWAMYPKKVGKKAVRQKWKARKLDDRADELIHDVLRRTDQDRQWRQGFIPNPLTYINGDRWEDEIDTRDPGKGQQSATANAKTSQDEFGDLL